MPNHCTNEIAVSGSPADLEAFRSLCDGGTYEDGEPRPMSFQRVLPMPEAVRATGSLDGLVSLADRGVPAAEIPDAELDRYVGEPSGHWVRFPDRDAVRERYATLLENRRLHGEAGWYGWANANWGTKWDAYDASPLGGSPEEGTLLYRFDTAWAPPVPVLLELSRRFPAVEMDLDWHEEGGRSGRMVFRGGDYTEE